MNSLIFKKKSQSNLLKKNKIFSHFFTAFFGIKNACLHMHERILKDSFKKEFCLGE